MTIKAVQSENLWTDTPLVYSSHISDIIGCSAYLKLEVRHRFGPRATYQTGVRTESATFSIIQIQRYLQIRTTMQG